MITWLDKFLSELYFDVKKSDGSKADTCSDFINICLKTLVVRLQDKEYQCHYFLYCQIISILTLIIKLERIVDEDTAKAIYNLPGLIRPSLISSLSISEELVRAFSDANPPENTSLEELIDEKSWYLDFPVNSLPVLNGSFIQAIIMNDSSCTVIIKRYNSSETAHISWFWDMDDFAIFGPSIDYGLAQSIRNTLTNVLQLILVYNNKSSNVVKEELSHVPVGILSKYSGDKFKNKHKSHSIFNIAKIKLPKCSFGRTIDASKGWSLEQTVSVSGHFKLQAYGKKLSKRKLIWVNPYKKGSGIEKVKMDIIA